MSGQKKRKRKKSIWVIHEVLHIWCINLRYLHRKVNIITLSMRHDRDHGLELFTSWFKCVKMLPTAWS